MRPANMLSASDLRIGVGLTLCGLSVLAPACKKRPLASAQRSAASSASSAPATPSPRCAEPKPGSGFTIGERTSPSTAEGDTEDEGEKSDQPGLPFAVEMGAGVAFGEG